MLEYQEQNSLQTLSEGIEEYFKANKGYLSARVHSAEADEFFKCHDALHVVFGCDISLNDEMIVKISSLFGTTERWNVLKGYRLPESKEIYAEIRAFEVIHSIVSSFVLIPRSIWRCCRMRELWPWQDFDEYTEVPLAQLRESFGIRVAH